MTAFATFSFIVTNTSVHILSRVHRKMAASHALLAIIICLYCALSVESTLQIEIIHRIAWRRSSRAGGSCSQTTIDNRVLIGGGTLYCQIGCRGSVGSMAYYCTDFTTTEDWSVGERTYIYNASGVTYFEAS